MNKVTALVFVCGCCMGNAALADRNEVVREYTFDTSDIEEIIIKANVGELNIIPVKGNEINLTLEIEGKRGGWFYKRQKDVSDVELISEVRGKRLYLEQTEENTATEWTIRLPQVASTRITLGVGEIQAEFANTELDVELGVGDINIDYPEDYAGRIELDVGVGDAGLHGGKDVKSKRAVVSQSINAWGNGDREITVDIGVGDVDLDLF